MAAFFSGRRPACWVRVQSLRAVPLPPRCPETTSRWTFTAFAGAAESQTHLGQGPLCLLGSHPPRAPLAPPRTQTPGGTWLLRLLCCQARGLGGGGHGVTQSHVHPEGEPDRRGPLSWASLRGPHVWLRGRGCAAPGSGRPASLTADRPRRVGQPWGRADGEARGHP